jgi:hypothetical protein
VELKRRRKRAPGEVLMAGTLVEVNVSELGLVTVDGKVGSRMINVNV